MLQVRQVMTAEDSFLGGPGLESRHILVGCHDFAPIMSRQTLNRMQCWTKNN